MALAAQVTPAGISAPSTTLVRKCSAAFSDPI